MTGAPEHASDDCATNEEKYIPKRDRYLLLLTNYITKLSKLGSSLVL